MASAPTKPIKKFLPNTLFGRALLILVLPVVFVQLFAIYIFYESHWDSIVRNLSSTLAGEVLLLVHTYESDQSGHPTRAAARMGDMIGIGVSFDNRQHTVFVDGKGHDDYPDFFAELSSRLSRPFMVQRVGQERDVLISILMEGGTLRLSMTKKRLVSSTTTVFTLWIVGSSTILLLIAMLFLRNQIRPIRLLAQAAEQFGMGQDSPDFRPRGAAEVRQAGRAFVTMRDRIRRQIDSRTEMLAGISHDLRTPLTRIRLQLALCALEDTTRKAMESDIGEMEHMIQEYLDFARGEGQEQSEAIHLPDYLRDIVSHYQLHSQPVEMAEPTDHATLTIRPKAMRRALQNVIDNAVRYGKHATLSITQTSQHLLLHIDDEGPGIAEDKQAEVFRPFTRLDPSRNIATGGAGLGLSITRDIVQSHGGKVLLENRDMGGLRVTLRLPLKQDNTL